MNIELKIPAGFTAGIFYYISLKAFSEKGKLLGITGTLVGYYFS